MGQFLNNKEPYDKYRTVKNGPYFVDKSEILEELIPALQQEQRFFCITRPRRFGKTIMANMIAAFFENTEEESLFDDLYISKNKKLCEKHLGKYPVVFLSLKNVDGLTFEEAKYKLMELIGMEAERFSFLMNSEKLSENDKNKYHVLTQMFEGQYSIPDGSLTSSMQT